MIGQVVGHYRITSVLGTGGMGTVYRADDLRLQRPVAIKFVSPHLSRDLEAHQRLLREARSASALDHPHIGVVYEVAETGDGQLYIVMALYEGGTLRQRLDQGPLPIDEALRLGRQITEGLAAAHAAGIVHRDLKPENILLTRDGQVRIVDFGLAKSQGQTRMTRTGSAAGTVAYMSPEQARGDDVDARTDLFSLGVILYEMLGGRPPFRGGSDSAVLYQVVHEEPPALVGLRSEVPKPVRQLVVRLLAKDPAQRYQDAAAVLADLGRGRVRRRWPRRRVFLAFAGTIAILSLANWWAWPRYLSETARFKRELVRLQNDKRPFVIAVAPFAATDRAAQDTAKTLRGVCVQELNRLLAGDQQVQVVTGQETAIVRTELEARAFAKQTGADVVLWGGMVAYGDTISFMPSVSAMPRALLSQIALIKMSSSEGDRSPRSMSMRGDARAICSLAAIVCGEYYIMRGDEGPRAIALVRAVNDDDLFIQVQKARSLARLSLFEEAAVVNAEIVTRCPDSSIARTEYGVTLYSLGRVNESIDQYREALRLSPRNYEAYVELGWSLSMLGRYADARESFAEAVVAAVGKNADAYSHRGQALNSLNRREEALVCSRKAVELDPYNVSYRFDLGCVNPTV